MVLLSLIANAKRNSIRKSSYCSLEKRCIKDLFQPRYSWTLKKPEYLLENTKIRSRTLVSRRNISGFQRTHLILFVRHKLHFYKGKILIPSIVSKRLSIRNTCLCIKIYTNEL